MRQIIILGLLTLLTLDLRGQVVGKIFINGQEFTDGSTDQKYFDFKPLTARLTKNGKEYLDSFAKFYLANHGTKDSVKIVIDPAETPEEREIEKNQIGLKRALTACNYLKDKYGILTKARIHQSILSCVLTGTISRTDKNKKEKRK